MFPFGAFKKELNWGSGLGVSFGGVNSAVLLVALASEDL